MEILDVGDLSEENPPRTPDELHAWVRNVLGMTIARSAVIEGHQAPFDYLAHTFFSDALEGAGARQDAPERPADCVVWANRGGGKTFLGAVATLLDLVFKPGIEVRILAGSMDQSRRMYAHLRRLFSPKLNPRMAALVDGKVAATRFTLLNGSGVELMAQSQTSVRGTRVQKLRCDEVDLFKPEVWEAAQLTTRSARCGQFMVRGSVECLSTMHIPHGVMHGVVKEAHEGKRMLFRWGVVDVLEHCGEHRLCRAVQPSLHHASPDASSGTRECPLLEECGGRAKLRPTTQGGHVEIEDAISQKRRVSKAAWESEMLCLRPSRSDAVIPEFNPEVHVFTDDGFLRDSGEHAAGKLRWIGGMDFGIRVSVVLWAALDADGVVWVVDERHEKDAVLDEHIEAMRRGLSRVGIVGWPRLEWIGVDPAGFSRSDQTGECSIGRLRGAGLNAVAARGKVRESQELLRARFQPASGTPRLFIHARCEKLIESLVRHRYRTTPSGKDQPDKREGYDHAVDALRYMILNLDRPRRESTMNFREG